MSIYLHAFQCTRLYVKLVTEMRGHTRLPGTNSTQLRVAYEPAAFKNVAYSSELPVQCSTSGVVTFKDIVMAALMRLLSNGLIVRKK